MTITPSMMTSSTTGSDYDDDGDIDFDSGFEYDEQHNPPSVGNSTVNDSDTEHEPNASTEELYQQCLAEIDIAWHCIPQK